MLALSAAVPAAANPATLPLVLTIAVAVVALVAVAVYVRRARRAGTLSRMTATASAVSAAGIVASALLVSIAFGGAPAASATSDSPASTVGSHTVESPTDDLTGYQLPTE
jgi:hypothetical protein